MPSGEWSAASARVKPATAALVVSYCRLPPPATTERTEATLTMAPPLLRRISGTAALAQKTYPIRLTSRISFQLAALASSTFSYLRMPALLMRMSRRPNFCAAPVTKSRHAASLPTSDCAKATLAPAVSSSAATRSPRSSSRSQNATLAPSATKRLTVASPIPDAPPVTAATLPSSLPMFATFHCIVKRASTIRRIHPAGTALLARPECPTLTDCGSFKRSLSGPFDGLTRSGLGRIEPLPLAWSCDRLRRDWAIAPPSANHRVRSIHIPGLAAETGWAAIDRRAHLEYRQSGSIGAVAWHRYLFSAPPSTPTTQLPQVARAGVSAMPHWQTPLMLCSVPSRRAMARSRQSAMRALP